MSSLDTTHIEKYADVMTEIKLRVDVIHHFLREQRDYLPPTIETVGLQFRKVFELIVFASLAANRERYSAIYSDFSKHWEAAQIVKTLRRINRDFYPMPVVEQPSSQPTAAFDLAKRDDDYLTEDELTEAHGRCGKLMHASNPYGQPIDYAFYQCMFPVWLTRVINLLNNHQIRLFGEEGFWLIHMLEEGKGQQVLWHRFEPTK